MIERSQIERENVLRTELGFSDLLAAARLLRSEVPRFGRTAALLLALLVGEVGAQVGVAIATREVLDEAIGAGRFALVAALIGLGFALVSFLLLRARQAHQEHVALAARAQAVSRVAANIQSARFEDLASVPMASLREIVMTDIEFAYRFLVETSAQLAAIAVWLVAAIVLVAILSPPILAVMVGLAVVFVLAIGRGTKRHLALTGERFVRLSDLSQRARDLVEVDRIMVARQFGLERSMERMFTEAHELFVAVALEQGKLAAEVRSGILTLNSIAFLAIVTAGGAQIASGDLQAGGLIAIIFVVGQLLANVAQVSDSVHRAAETAASGRRISAYWSGDVEERVAAPAEPIERLSAHAVSFAYGDEGTVLDGIDAELERGELTSLTAEIGAGKTTLALLLAGLLHPDGGEIRVNGVAGAAAAALAAGRILYVGSKPVLFEGSVLDNLFLDRPLEERDRAMLGRLGLDGRVLPLEQPILGPNGTGVSSGQGQLIQLARAVLRDPEAILLDEATGAMDIETEAAVQRELLEWCGRRACLVISHRRCPWTEAAGRELRLTPLSRREAPGTERN